MLPAYLIGMVLAGTVGKDHALVRRFRTLTFGLLTPFYFIRAGSFVSIPELVAAPAAFVVFLVVKVGTKMIGVYPVTKLFGSPNKEAMYTTLLMSTGLTFGTISALFGLSHGIIDQRSIFGARRRCHRERVIPTVIANAFYLPRHLLPERRSRISPSAARNSDRRCVSPQQPNSSEVRSMFSKILHANDGSEQAFHALSLALAIAKQNDSELHMVSVEEISYMPEFIEESSGRDGNGGSPFSCRSPARPRDGRRGAR